MSLTPSNMLPLGTAAPDFSLLDTVSGKTLNLKDLQSDVATVIMFICNHCPYVIHIQEAMVDVAARYQKQGIAFIAISANDVENYPDDSPELMKIEAQENNYTFPYLYDETQDVAKAYQAACTPDFFIFNGDLKCVYRGCFDESSPGKSTPVTGEHLANALDNMLANKPVDAAQKASMGCNIKWKE